MLCGSCQDNYYKSSWLRCDLCETQDKLIIYAFLRVLWLTIVIMGMVQLNLVNAKKESKQYSAFLQQIKLMVNHCVVMAAVLSIDYKWESLVPNSGAPGEDREYKSITIRYVLAQILKIQEVIAEKMSKLIAFSCLLQSSGQVVNTAQAGTPTALKNSSAATRADIASVANLSTIGSASAASPQVNMAMAESLVKPERLENFFRELLFAVASPLLMIALLQLLLTLSSCFKGKFILEKDKLVCITVVTLWLFQPDICHILFASFSCIEIEGKQRLLSDLDIVCWEGNHQIFFNYITIPGLVIYVLALPAFFFSVVHNQREMIELNAIKQDLNKVKQLQVEKFITRFGFLFNGYKKQYFYWDLIVMMRKVLVIFATEYLKTISNEIQVLISVILVVTNILIVINLKPFIDRQQG